ncbi:eva-1 homolog Bb [Boleophthalmus pectinirostris]|uniref:eva-1 homolog Bb n=1 Tax=Boleophthalmus pectinirostris TaxID=150288 RepID=UPI00242EC7A1|nr:eva-1 homolog Bb [Boleophthalmus pectinirostris]
MSSVGNYIGNRHPHVSKRLLEQTTDVHSVETCPAELSPPLLPSFFILSSLSFLLSVRMEPIHRDMELFSNSMATFAHIRANPESLALFFMMGVCLGLFSALCLLVAGITCRRRLLHRNNNNNNNNKPPKPSSSSSSSSSPPDLQAHREPGSERVERASRDGAPRPLEGSGLDVFSSEEELEKARRLEERERILREIWRNGQPDVLVTGTGTIGRVHYH